MAGFQKILLLVCVLSFVSWNNIFFNIKFLLFFIIFFAHLGYSSNFTVQVMGAYLRLAEV